MRLKNIVKASLAAAAVAATATVAMAQSYPTKPITMIVPWPAGGSTDVAMRAIAEAASKHLGQPIVTDNSGNDAPSVFSAKVFGVFMDPS